MQSYCGLLDEAYQVQKHTQCEAIEVDSCYVTGTGTVFSP